VTTASSFTVPNDAGQHVFVHAWLPPEPARAVVLVAHGMAEHGGRYARLGRVLAKNGLAVYAPDHRGHGETAAGRLGWGGADAWNGTIRDLAALADRARAAHPGAPLFLMGHSMGSIATQRFLQLHGNLLQGAILSGTTSVLPGAEQIVPAARAQAEGGAAEEPSPFAALMFASFNDGFQPVATPFDWLSRDEAEVAKYIADPFCGFVFSSGLLADHLAGWVETWLPANEARLPTSLPLLVFSGALDPVGANMSYVTALVERYRALGIGHIETIAYPGGRHEMLNETNRDDVHSDILTWLNARL